MFKNAIFGALAAGSILAMPAQAATVPALGDSYAGLYDVESVYTHKNPHSFWLPNFLKTTGTRGSRSHYWQFDENGGAFAYDGNSATLTGTIQNNIRANAFFEVSVSLAFDQRGGRAPKCEFGGRACKSAEFAKQSAEFDYFKLGGATLTGAGEMEGLVLELSDRPVNALYPPQLGFGGNNKGFYDFGMSTWFFWDAIQNSKGLPLSSDRRGDINIQLALAEASSASPVSQVPLPASLVLFLAALGGLGVAAHGRQRNAGV